jgi:hypothetical protein
METTHRFNRISIRPLSGILTPERTGRRWMGEAWPDILPREEERRQSCQLEGDLQ